MQAPIVKPDNLQYIVDGIYKELTELKIKLNEVKAPTVPSPAFKIVKLRSNSYQVQFTHPDGNVTISASLGG